MFDVLLSLVEKDQVKLIEIYLKEREEKGEGLFTIIKDNNKADIRYYLPGQFPYDDVAEEYKEKSKNLSQEEIKVKDKWIVTLPILEIETDKDTVIPIWNLVLDDGKDHVFFQGFPQEVDLQNGQKGLQYVLVAEPHEATIAKNNWTVEATTIGQKYLQKCFEASQDYFKFLIFRSDSDISRVLTLGKREDGNQILKRIFNSPDSKELIENLDNFRKNDAIGSPMTYGYNKHGHFSPSTLRYVNTLRELHEHFGDMENWNMVEFGGGYGGLCHILSYLVKWNKYSFIEIKEPLELAKKVFMATELDINCLEPNEVDKKKNMICS